MMITLTSIAFGPINASSVSTARSAFCTGGNPWPQAAPFRA